MDQSVNVGEGNCRVGICDEKGLAGDFGAVRGEEAGLKEEMRKGDIFGMNEVLKDVWDPTVTQLILSKDQIMCLPTWEAHRVECKHQYCDPSHCHIRHSQAEYNLSLTLDRSLS